MDKDNNDTTFKIEGDPGQNNTFIKIGTAYNINPNATEVNNTFYLGTREDRDKAIAEAMGGEPQRKKLGAMTLREMLKNNLIDTGNLQKEILNYVSCVRIKLKKELDKQFVALWASIVEHEAFAVDLYDPGKQQCTYNRNLVANIIHYLDSKGFYEDRYSAADMTRALEGGDDQHPVRAALGKDPDSKFCMVVDEILKELRE